MPSASPTRSPSPWDRYDSAASTYYQPGNTLQQSNSTASLGSQRSLSSMLSAVSLFQSFSKLFNEFFKALIKGCL